MEFRNPASLARLLRFLRTAHIEVDPGGYIIVHGLNLCLMFEPSAFGAAVYYVAHAGANAHDPTTPYALLSAVDSPLGGGVTLSLDRYGAVAVPARVKLNHATGTAEVRAGGAVAGSTATLSAAGADVTTPGGLLLRLQDGMAPPWPVPYTASPANFAPTAAITWETVADLVIPNPNRSVAITAEMVAYWTDTVTATGRSRVRVGLSTNGGGAFTYGPEEHTSTGTGAGYTTRTITVAHHVLAAAVPTGNIVARLQTYALAGSIGNVLLTNPHYTVTVSPT